MRMLKLPLSINSPSETQSTWHCSVSIKSDQS